MKFVESTGVADINKAFDRLYRRVVALENASAKALDHSAPTNPIVGMSWLDIENGKLNIYDGSVWTTYTKDS